jgi:hypothetical protein
MALFAGKTGELAAGAIENKGDFSIGTVPAM